uniref:Uncharacterized protein n=1 Tax=Panagrolaimus sp. PS1159 TaxID=55785 RepID=A0AC35FMD3_9BILA
MGKILYNDKFVELHHDKIVLKCYYFPTAKSKIIPLKDVQSIFYDTQENSMIFTIGWGVTIFGVWWGLDLKRQFPSFKTKYSNVIFDCGSSIKQGFTVVDIDEFLKALQPLLTKNVFFVNKISDKFDTKDAAKTSPIKNISLVESDKSTSWKADEATANEENQLKYKPNHFCINQLPPPSYEEATKKYLG